MPVPSSVKIGGLLALVAADVLLVAAVIRGGSSPAPVSVGTSPTVSSTTATPSSTATTKASSAANDAVGAFSAVNADVAFQGGASKCGGSESTVRVTTDAGRTWKILTVPGLGTVTRAEFTSPTTGYLVGADKDCTIAVVRTTDAGRTWSDPVAAKDYWTAVPDSATEVQSARGKVVKPCGSAEVDQLTRVSDDRALVLCADASVRETTDGGKTWAARATVPGARAMAVQRGDGGLTLVAAVDSGCDGIRVWSVPKKGPAKGEGCVPAKGAKDAQVTLGSSAGGGRTWLVVGDLAWQAGKSLNSWVKG